MLRYIVSILINVIYCVVLNLELYTDRAMMPGGQVREWRRSPIARLNLSGQPWLAVLQIVLTAVSIVTSGLVLFGVKNRTVKTVQLISTVASTLMFILIMIVTANTHAKYA